MLDSMLAMRQRAGGWPTTTTGRSRHPVVGHRPARRRPADPQGPRRRGRHASRRRGRARGGANLRPQSPRWAGPRFPLGTTSRGARILGIPPTSSTTPTSQRDRDPRRFACLRRACKDMRTSQNVRAFASQQHFKQGQEPCRPLTGAGINSPCWGSGRRRRATGRRRRATGRRRRATGRRRRTAGRRRHTGRRWRTAGRRRHTGR
jgi:hypothetical protein